MSHGEIDRRVLKYQEVLAMWSLLGDMGSSRFSVRNVTCLEF